MLKICILASFCDEFSEQKITVNKNSSTQIFFYNCGFCAANNVSCYIFLLRDRHARLDQDACQSTSTVSVQCKICCHMPEIGKGGANQKFICAWRWKILRMKYKAELHDKQIGFCCHKQSSWFSQMQRYKSVKVIGSDIFSQNKSISNNYESLKWHFSPILFYFSHFLICTSVDFCIPLPLSLFNNYKRSLE